MHYAPLVGDDVVLDAIVPYTRRDQILRQMLVHDDKLTRHRATRVYIARNWLETLVVS